MTKRNRALLLAGLSAGLSLAAGMPSAAQGASIGLNIAGVTLAQGESLNSTISYAPPGSDGSYAPPDSDGGVGPNNVVQFINGAFAVYDKPTGAAQQLISGRQFWINAGVGDPGTSILGLGAFNARVIYDPTVGRWFAAELTGDTTDNRVLLARSDTSNPLGTWKGVSFLGNAGGGDKFADFTTLGVNANGVYVTTNNFPSNTQGGFNSISIFSLPKADLLQAFPTLTNLTRLDALDTGYGQTLQPVTNFGPAPASTPLVAAFPNIGPVSFLLRSDLTGTSGPGALLSPSSPDTINTATYNDPPKAAQPDGTRSISTIDSRIGANVYQVGNVIYAAHSTVVAGNAAVTWLKINATTNQVIQEGILSNPQFDYFQPSIAANANGDIVISFTRSGLGAGGNLSTFAVIGKTLGGVTSFGSPFVVQAGTVSNYHNNPNDRWGDYTTTVVDPSNPNAFWTFYEFASSSDAWATGITEIIVPEPASILLGAMALGSLLLAARRRRMGG